MNVILLSTLEKREGEERARTAQLTIGEAKGAWSAIWSESKDAGPVKLDTWYDGPSWEELLLAFRMHVGEKLAGGFKPLLNIPADHSALLQNERARSVLMLQYYCESNPDEQLYDKLRAWRREQAAKEKKASYMVASNRMLRMVSVLLPRTMEELLQVPGFGELKVKLYAQELFRIMEASERQTSFPLNWVADKVDDAEFERWLGAQREQKAKSDEDRRQRKHQLLEALAGGAGLEQLQKDLSMLRREIIQWIEELDKEGYSVERLVHEELSRVNVEIRESAARLFQAKGDRYLKPVLQELYSEEEVSGIDVDYVYAWLRLLRIEQRHLKETRDQLQAS